MILVNFVRKYFVYFLLLSLFLSIFAYINKVKKDSYYLGYNQSVKEQQALFNEKYNKAILKLKKENEDFKIKSKQIEDNLNKEIDLLIKEQKISKKKLSSILREKQNIEKNNICKVSDSELEFFNK